MRLGLIGVWIAAALCLLAPPASADDAADPLALLATVTDDELATMRGGFTTSDGLEINIGLEQAVLIDGIFKTTFALNLAPAGTSSSAVQAGLLAQDKLIQLIQTGGNNNVSQDVTDGFASGVLTLIQNSLDTKLIQNLTVLNVGVSNVSGFRANTLGADINFGLAQSLR